MTVMSLMVVMRSLECAIADARPPAVGVVAVDPRELTRSALKSTSV